jgi:hypothetical protein
VKREQTIRRFFENRPLDEKNKAAISRLLFELDDDVLEKVLDKLSGEKWIIAARVEELINQEEKAGEKTFYIPIRDIDCPVCGRSYKYKITAGVEEWIRTGVLSRCPICWMPGEDVVRDEKHLRQHGTHSPGWFENIEWYFERYRKNSNTTMPNFAPILDRAEIARQEKAEYEEKEKRRREAVMAEAKVLQSIRGRLVAAGVAVPRQMAV